MSLTATETSTAATIAPATRPVIEPVAGTRSGTATGSRSRRTVWQSFGPLLMDVGAPLGSYYLLKSTCDLSTVAALGWSSVVPAARTVWGVVKERRLNGLAALILFVNVAGLLLGLVTGDPRLMLAKDSAISSVVGIGVLASLKLGRPMMTAAVKPFVVKGDAARAAAWERLAAGSEEFRRAERTFSLVWGAALLGECVLRAVGAYTVPVDTMVWLGSVVMVATMVLAFMVSGARAVVPMKMMLRQELASEGRC
ncbi:VC0807 family protein [Streptomyces sp. NPDC008313]|uniref:VC0807 family protein n=1 Tax=Streptomyces sp. NPDC008313 TaxID=3364826 RepID=UPI0036E4F2FC